MSASGQRALRYGILAAAMLGLLVLVVAFFPWSALRGPVAAYLSHRLHREVTIEGPLRVHVGLPVVVDVENFSIANAAWSDLQPMAHAARVTLTFSVPSLLHFSPDAIQLVEPRLILEKNRNGEANWHFGGSGSGKVPAFGDIAVDNGSLRYRDPQLHGDITVAVQSTASAAGNAPQELRFDGRGTLRDEPFTIRGRGHGFSALRRVDDPYRLAFALEAGQTAIDFDGTIVPAQPQNVRGALHVRGPDLAALYPIVPSPLPWTPPYDLRGDLVHESAKWHFENISGTIGKSDLAGRYGIDKTSGRPVTLADLTSKRLDYRDLAGFLGMHSKPSASRSKSANGKTQPGKPRTGHVLPDTAFNLGKLRDHDVDLRLRGKSVRWERFPLDNLDMHLVLADGRLHLQPLDFGIADGHVVNDITVDFTKEEPSGKAQIEIRRVELKRLFPGLASPQGSAGRFGGRAHFTTSGNSVAELLGSMNGEAAVAMRGGEMSTLTLVLTNLDLARAAALLASGKREKAPIHCAITAMHAKNGQLVPDFMIIDSEDELIRGSGSIDFRDEKYDLTLNADSKKPSLVALRGPIEITGTFANPVVRPAVGQAVARVGAAVGLGILAPPLALLPLIDLGDAPDADCRSLYQKADLAAKAAAQHKPASSENGKRSKEPGEKLAGTR